DFLASQPAHHSSRDLVAERIAEQSLVARARPDSFPDRAIDVGCLVTVGQISGVLLRGESDHDAQTVLCRDVEQVERRHRVRNPDRGEAGISHPREIVINGTEPPVLATMGVWSEGSVGHTPRPEFFIPDIKELSATDRSLPRGVAVRTQMV